MNRATALAVAAVAALATLTACSSSSSDSKPAPAKTSSSAPAKSDALAAAGIPPKPTGQTRTDLLAALRKVNRALVADEDDAIDNARNQCSAINGGAHRLDYLAQQRFSSSTHEVSTAEAQQINKAIGSFCKTA